MRKSTLRRCSRPRVELAAGSPLYLDMTLWRVGLFDRGDVLATFLEERRGRMRALGSRRVPFKGAAFRDYKPGLSAGNSLRTCR